ncbi:MAG: coniferyl aldehyde dehydrogenase, partial [Polyangiaceae bacterium]
MTMQTETVPESTIKSDGVVNVGLNASMAVTLKKMKEAQRASGAPTYEQRIASLDKLEKLVLKHKNAFAEAISKDFGNRSKHETLIAEVFIVQSEIQHARDHLRDWMETETREVKWTFMPARAEVIMQPLGVVGIISPWNYPVQLALAPLVGVIAAGNRAMIKPSEYVPATAALLAKALGESFSATEVAVVTGGPEVGEAFAKLPFDHLVFTGSTAVGKIVMRAASENLTPVTLELGGKSPAIVGDDFGIEEAAKRIMLGKLFNAGQTCIAPDYVLVPKGKVDAFVEACKTAATKMYPTFGDNADYTSIVNARHYDRLKRVVSDAKEQGAKIVEINPGNEDLAADKRKLLPTLVLNATDEMTVMQDEIFGPILPVKSYATLAEAIDYVNDHPRPLALYFFGHDQAEIDRVLETTTSGGVSINETMLHCAQDALPFGGVGASGMGAYHG